MNEMNIKIIWNELFDTYSVTVENKEIITGASQDEIEALTIKTIIELSTKED